MSSRNRDHADSTLYYDDNDLLTSDEIRSPDNTNDSDAGVSVRNHNSFSVNHLLDIEHAEDYQPDKSTFGLTPHSPDSFPNPITPGWNAESDFEQNIIDYTQGYPEYTQASPTGIGPQSPDIDARGDNLSPSQRLFSQMSPSRDVLSQDLLPHTTGVSQSPPDSPIADFEAHDFPNEDRISNLSHTELIDRETTEGFSDYERNDFVESSNQHDEQFAPHYDMEPSHFPSPSGSIHSIQSRPEEETNTHSSNEDTNDINFTTKVEMLHSPNESPYSPNPLRGSEYTSPSHFERNQSVQFSITNDPRVNSTNRNVHSRVSRTRHVRSPDDPARIIDSLQSPNGASHTSESPAESVHKLQSPSGSVHSPQSPIGSVHSQQSPSSSIHSPQSPAVSGHSPKSATGSMHSPQSPTGSIHSPQSPTGSIHSPQSPTGSIHSPQSPTGSIHSPQSPTGSIHSPQSPTGSIHSPQSPTGSIHSPQSPTGSVHSPGSPTGSIHSPQSPTGSIHSPQSATGSIHSPQSATRSIHDDHSIIESAHSRRSPTGNIHTSESPLSPNEQSARSPIGHGLRSPNQSVGRSSPRENEYRQKSPILSPKSHTGSVDSPSSAAICTSQLPRPRSATGSLHSQHSPSHQQSLAGSLHSPRSPTGSLYSSHSVGIQSPVKSPPQSPFSVPQSPMSDGNKSPERPPMSPIGISSPNDDKEIRNNEINIEDSDTHIESKESKRPKVTRAENDAESDKESAVGELIADIFGSDDDDEEFEGFGEADVETAAKLDKQKGLQPVDDITSEGGGILPDISDDEDSLIDDRRPQRSNELSDFDIMMAKRKSENQKRRRKKRNEENITDNDDLIVEMINNMKTAAEDDRRMNENKRPAIHKLKYLPYVMNQLKKSDLHGTLIDCGILSAMTEWLAPLPDRSLPHLKIREILLKTLLEFPGVNSSTLKSSGIGKAVMYLCKHPKEMRENKELAVKLINEWSRPIFNLTSNFKLLTKEEREQRDYEQLPKRRRLSAEGADTPRRDIAHALTGDDKALRPGDPGWIMRARVPVPSHKDYVVRPKWNVEEVHQRPSTKKKISRYEKHKRAFAERKKKVKNILGMSIEGRNMAL